MNGGAFVEVVTWVTTAEVQAVLEPGPPKAYVAAPYELRVEAQLTRLKLEAKGYGVTSRWLTVLDEDSPEMAEVDIEDIEAANELVLVNPEHFRRTGTGGRHVEVGYALALGKKITIVGVRSNLFHMLPSVRVVDRLEDL